MDNWDEIRTAYQVARSGTVSGAAGMLGVHHATVIRHVDALEARLGVKLFQRHARGYTPTEAGEDLLRVAQATDDQFSQLAGRLRGRGEGVSGELVVTSLVAMTPFLAPILADFQDNHPDLVVRLLTGERLFRLEYGEAHVALRGGPPPEEPDNVVQRLTTTTVAMYASEGYIARNGLPDLAGDLSGHRFVGHDDEHSRAPYFQWLRAHVSADQVTFRSNDFEAMEHAVRSGAGIGFMAPQAADRLAGLVEVAPPRPEWEGAAWLVTHVDLHRSAKVQAFVRFLKARIHEKSPT